MAFGIVQIEVRHVEQVEIESGRRVHHPRARIEQRLPGGLAAKLRRHVDAAEEQRVDQAARLRDLDTGIEPLVGLDDDVEPDRLRGLLDQFGVNPYFVGRLHLRQHQRGRWL